MGRPIIYSGDPDAPDLTPQERRRIRRRIANRESARRVRAKRQDLIEEMSIKVGVPGGSAKESSNIYISTRMCPGCVVLTKEYLSGGVKEDVSGNACDIGYECRTLLLHATSVRACIRMPLCTPGFVLWPCLAQTCHFVALTCPNLPSGLCAVWTSEALEIFIKALC